MSEKNSSGFGAGFVLGTFLGIFITTMFWVILTLPNPYPRKFDVVTDVSTNYVELKSGVIIYSPPDVGMFPGDTINHFHIHGKVH